MPARHKTIKIPLDSNHGIYRDRFARNDDLRAAGATNQPDGQITKNLSSPRAKNIPLNPSGKSALPTRPSHPMRGALRNVTNARWDAVDAALAKTNAR
jgi:hypothetical protein